MSTILSFLLPEKTLCIKIRSHFPLSFLLVISTIFIFSLNGINSWILQSANEDQNNFSMQRPLTRFSPISVLWSGPRSSSFIAAKATTSPTYTNYIGFRCLLVNLCSSFFGRPVVVQHLPREVARFIAVAARERLSATGDNHCRTKTLLLWNFFRLPSVLFACLALVQTACGNGLQQHVMATTKPRHGSLGVLLYLSCSLPTPTDHR